MGSKVGVHERVEGETNVCAFIYVFVLCDEKLLKICIKIHLIIINHFGDRRMKKILREITSNVSSLNLHDSFLTDKVKNKKFLTNPRSN